MKRLAVGDGLFFVTITVVDWLDIFTRVEYKDFIVQQLNYCIENKGLEIYGYVIMTNHLHLIVRGKENEHLYSILRDFKTYTSKKLVEMIQNNPRESRKNFLLNTLSNAKSYSSKNKKYKLWKDGNYPFQLNSTNTIKQKLNYIHQNPVRTGVVDESWKYKYSSANPNSPVKILFL